MNPSDEEEIEDKIIEDIIKNELYEHKKIEAPYVPPTVKDAVKIENRRLVELLPDKKKLIFTTCYLMTCKICLAETRNR